MDFEGTAITLFVGIVAAAAAGFIAWLFRGKERAATVEKTRSEKADSERRLAKELRTESEEEAVAVRQEMRHHVDNLLVQLRSEIELAKSKDNNLENLQNMKVEQLAKEFVEFKASQNSINEKTVKSIEFVQTMLWGPEAKSMPPYMLGLEETKEHRDEPDVGMFTDPQQKKK